MNYKKWSRFFGAPADKFVKGVCVDCGEKPRDTLGHAVFAHDLHGEGRRREDDPYN